MLKAELHGKISSDCSNADDRREDLLTSNVFGVLHYSPPDLVLLPWLAMARCFADGARPLIAKDIVDAEIVFWPRLGQRQADGLIVLRAGGVIDLIVLECKLAASKHDAAPSDQLAGGDQLADYLHALRTDLLAPCPQGQVRTRALLYVTADAAMPRHELEASAQAAGEPAAFHWLSWRSLREVLEDALHVEGVDAYRRRMLADLQELLERKGLKRFRGFEHLGPVPVHAPRARWFGLDRWSRLGQPPDLPPSPSWFQREERT